MPTAEFVVVWRDAEGAALQTYAHELNKAARTFSDPNAPELAGSEPITEDELQKLLDKRTPFPAKRVPKTAVKKLLGWTV